MIDSKGMNNHIVCPVYSISNSNCGNVTEVPLPILTQNGIKRARPLRNMIYHILSDDLINRMIYFPDPSASQRLENQPAPAGHGLKFQFDI